MGPDRSGALHQTRKSGGAKGGALLPDPLADPLVDINIQPGEAKPYLVKAGEFIQVLDAGAR